MNQSKLNTICGVGKEYWGLNHHLLSYRCEWIVKWSRDECHGFRPGFCIHFLCELKQAPCQAWALFLQLLNGRDRTALPLQA